MRKRKWWYWLLFLMLLMSACTSAPPAEPEGPMFGDLPLIAGAQELQTEELPLALKFVTQAHKETVRQPQIGYFHVETEFIDTIEWYDDELRRFEWKLIDVLEFGDGGFLRRYYRGQQRAIVAFHPNDKAGRTEFLLLEGDVK